MRLCCVHAQLTTCVLPTTCVLSSRFAANACSFSLLVFFVVCIVFQIGSLTELPSVQNVISLEQLNSFVVPSDLLSFVLLACVFLSLALSLVMFAVQLRSERLRMEVEARMTKARRLRVKGSMKEVEVPTIEDNYFHTFLSQ